MFFHRKRNLILHHLFRQSSRIQICPVQNSHLLIRNIFSFKFLNLSQNIFCFFRWIRYFLYMNSLIWFLKCLDLFFKTHSIICDYPRSSLYNITGRSVIYIQKNLFCIRIVLHKFHHDSWFCTSESIYRLIIIPYYKQIILGSCQHAHYIILCLIYILKFINQDVFELLLPFFQYIRSAYKKFPAADQHILEINFTIVLLSIASSCR